MCTHFGGRHVGHRAMGLNGLKLVEAPVQLFQGLQSHLRVGLICKRTHDTINICIIASQTHFMYIFNLL